MEPRILVLTSLLPIVILAVVLPLVFSVCARRERRQLARGVPSGDPPEGLVGLRGVFARRVKGIVWNRVPAIFTLTRDEVHARPTLLDEERFAWSDVRLARWQGHLSPRKWLLIPWSDPPWVLHLELRDGRVIELAVRGPAGLLAGCLREAGVLVTTPGG